ncbi:MAG: leucine-rich repeat domain-containing protein [Paludibacteraceae bacterium]|nr:leucine-rich repeat domain-containing protein [Paludibacteraceae bacterium]
MANKKIPFIEIEKTKTSEEVFVYDGRSTFKGKTWVKNVAFQEGTRCIKESAFEGCTGLTSIVIPEGVTSIDYMAFSGCSNLEEIVFPESLRYIENCALGNCPNLTHLYLPQNLEKLCEYDSYIINLFSVCGKLKAFDVHPENKKYASYEGMLIINDELSICPQNNELTTIESFPDRVKRINEDAFCKCRNLVSVSIPNTVKCDELSFNGCANLKKLTVPASVKKLNITGCTSLTELEVDAANPNLKVVDGLLITTGGELVGSLNLTEAVIPEGVTSIESHAFKGCTALTSVTIPASVEKISYGVFLFCCNLKEIKVAAENKAFTVKDGMLMSKDETELYFCYNREEIIVPHSVTKVQTGAFTACRNAKIVMPPKYGYSSCMLFEGAENCTICISDYESIIYETVYLHTKDLTVEFYNAARNKLLKRDYRFCNVKRVVLPDRLTNLHNFAFQMCREMTDVVIPETVTEIGNYAFLRCESLEKLVIPNSVTVVHKDAFIGVKHVEIGNHCVIENAYLDLDAPFNFEGTAGRLYYAESTGSVLVRGADTDESRQIFECQRHWFGEVKPALQAIGCTFFYWDTVNKTFAARFDEYDYVFNGLELLPKEKVVGLVADLSTAFQQSPYAMKKIASLDKAKAVSKAKAAPKKPLFVTKAPETLSAGPAKAEKIEFMLEQMFLAQLSEYLEVNTNVELQISAVKKTGIDLGVNYKNRFSFSLSIPSKKVEDGSAAEHLTALLRQLDQNDINFNLI